MLAPMPDRDPDPTPPAADHNLTWHAGQVAPADRARAMGLPPDQLGMTLWLTGLSGSGKSTIAVALEQKLIAMGRPAFRLDGDNVRHGLNADLGFSAEDRTENIRRVGEVARLMAEAGLIVIACFISPYRADRERVRRMHEASNLRFIEVFVDTPLDICAARDPKGLYAKAASGQLTTGLTGISPDAPYEPPESPELVLKTGELGVEGCVAGVVEAMS